MLWVKQQRDIGRREYNHIPTTINSKESKSYKKKRVDHNSLRKVVSSVYHYTHMAGHTGVLKTYLDYYSALLLVGRLQRGKRGSVTMWYLHKKKIHST